MHVFIPNNITFPIPDRELFILTRPFKLVEGWGNEITRLKRWKLEDANIFYDEDPSKASLMLLPYAVNLYYATGNAHLLNAYNKVCQTYGIKGYAIVSGDWGESFPEFQNLIYFRMGGFRSQLSHRNQGFPVSLSDQLLNIYGTENPEVREKANMPVVGFCGHASTSKTKRLKEQLKFVFANSYRALRNPFRKDWEPLFPSAWHRAGLLNLLMRSNLVKTNFIFRQHYRAGATTPEAQQQTTLEYYNNIRQSDYVLCLRGGGNFSVRLYETLMMGRIPVFVDTDCLLPFPEKIDWKQHVVWVDWNDRQNIDKVLIDFHKSISAEDFRTLQLSNRRLWKEVLSIKGIFSMLSVV